MRLLRPRLSIFLAALFAIGCGGSAGPGTPVVPATTFRANALGDSWTYKATGSLPYLGNGRGTYSEFLQSVTYNNAPAIGDTGSFHLVFPGNAVTLATTNILSLTGQLIAVFDSGAYTSVTSNTYSVPSTIGPTTDAKGVLTLANGSTVTTEYKVVGKERVTVPAGTFDTWVVNETEAESGGTTSHFTLYVAPETGNWVKASAVTNYSSGQVFSWNASLESMVTVAGTSGETLSSRPTIRIVPKTF